MIYSAPEVNDFTCYRNVPCHQVCFYDVRLFAERGYDVKYRVRADYEHFLYCIYDRKAEAVYVEMIVADYEGGGFSRQGRTVGFPKKSMPKSRNAISDATRRCVISC